MSANYVFILGAGASAPVGVPTVPRFIRKVKEISRSKELSEKDQQAFNEFLTEILPKVQNPAIMKKLGKVLFHPPATFNIHNIEHIFMALEHEKSCQDFNLPEYSLAIAQHITAKTIELSARLPSRQRRTFSQHDTRFNSNGVGYPELAQSIIQLYRQNHKITIMNFNYDLCFDFEFSQQREKLINQGKDRIPYTNSTPPTPKLDYCLPKIDEKPEIVIEDCRNQAFKENHQPIKYLKPHGSLNWYKDNKGGIGIVDINEIKQRFFQNYEATSLPISQVLISKKHNGIPLIIPPVKNKPYQKLDFIHQQAKQALFEADHIIIIGYSLPITDKYMYDLISKSRHHATPIDGIHILDIDPSRKEYYQQVFYVEADVIEFYPGGFEDISKVSVLPQIETYPYNDSSNIGLDTLASQWP